MHDGVTCSSMEAKTWPKMGPSRCCDTATMLEALQRLANCCTCNGCSDIVGKWTSKWRLWMRQGDSYNNKKKCVESNFELSGKLAVVVAL
jgi:hypothetical protein